MRIPVGLPLLVCLGARAAAAQASPPAALPVSRAEAVETAIGRAGRLGVARADTAVAFAQLLATRARQNPIVSASYSKSVPNYHVAADLPIDLPAQRSARIRAAQAGRDAAQYRYAFERAGVALAADTAYTRALAARERLRLSRRNAVAADSLRLIAGKRRDAGDASDLDVELAMVNAEQQANVAATDSLALVSAVLDLQAAMGLATDGVAIAPSDSLAVPSVEPAAADPSGGVAPIPAGFVLAAAPRPGALPVTGLPATSLPAAGAAPLSIAAAQASLESAQLTALAERRSIFAAPSITAGFETGDPTGGEKGILPTVGVAIPLPLLNRNRGPIAQAEAERARARAALALAQVESRIEIARARRAIAIALEKVRRDQALVAAAERVATMSQTAYREGASPLPNVLEAQRNARDVRAQYVSDLADAWIATASLRVLTLTYDAPR